MRGTVLRIFLSGLIAAITTSGNAGSAAVTALSRIEGFPEIEQFEHLPYPLNLLATSRRLTETSQRQKLYQKLSPDQKQAMWKIEYHARLPYPNNVLHRMVEEIRTWNGKPNQYIDMLYADPSLMTTAFKYNNLGPETNIALEAFKYNAQDFLRQMLEIGFDPTKYYHIQSYKQRTRQRYAALAKEKHPQSYETIVRYATKKEKQPEWFKKLDSTADEKPLILQVEEKQAKTMAATPYVEILPPRREIDDEKTAENDTRAAQPREQRPHVHDIFAEMDVAQVAGEINREYQQRSQENSSLLERARMLLTSTLLNGVTTFFLPGQHDTQLPENIAANLTHVEELWAQAFLPLH